VSSSSGRTIKLCKLLACEIGFHRSEGVCKPNECTCDGPGGKTAATGADCPTDGAKLCTACNEGFQGDTCDECVEGRQWSPSVGGKCDEVCLVKGALDCCNIWEPDSECLVDERPQIPCCGGLKCGLKHMWSEDNSCMDKV